MSILQSFLLGILQGIAEFLPISSSGHLAVAQNLLKLDDVPILFDISLHVATLFAVVIFFRKKIVLLFKYLFRWIGRKELLKSESDLNSDVDYLTGNEEYARKTIIAVLLTNLVTGIIGVITSKFIQDVPIKLTCVGFIITALFLLLSRFYDKHLASKEKANKPISKTQALIIGFMQGIGTLPGISRSGSTITGALLSGVNKESACEYSFIVSIPAILAAFLLELKDLDKIASSVGILPILIGCLAAFCVGYLSLTLLMKVIKKGNLYWFAFYLIPVGFLGIFLLQ